MLGSGKTVCFAGENPAISNILLWTGQLVSRESHKLRGLGSIPKSAIYVVLNVPRKVRCMARLLLLVHNRVKTVRDSDKQV